MEPGGFVTVTYVLDGSADLLRVPLPKPARRVDGLWRHTCFEAFVAVKGTPNYYELNFSPSGEWAAYSFRSYRDGGALENDGLDPGIAVRREERMLALSAVMRLDQLPGIAPEASLRLGLCAVIEDIDGGLSYWALKHLPGKPDFHHPDTFTLEI